MEKFYNFWTCDKVTSLVTDVIVIVYIVYRMVEEMSASDFIQFIADSDVVHYAWYSV